MLKLAKEIFEAKILNLFLFFFKNIQYLFWIVQGQMWMIREFLPSMMEKDKGSLVSMCSIAGHAGCPYMVPYSASKFAVKGMMEALHQELRAQSPENKIHLMTVSPFIVETDMIKGASIRFPSTNFFVFSKTFQRQTV